MSFEVVIPVTLEGTEHTVEGLLPRVSPNVSLEVVHVLSLVRAVLARVGPFVTVTAHMAT